MGIQRAVPVVTTTSPVETRAFYEEVLGFEVAMEAAGFLMLRSPSVPTSQVILAWEVDDPLDPHVGSVTMSVDVGSLEAVQAAHDDAVARGLEIVRPVTDEPWGIRRCFVREPSGAVINVAAHL